MANKYWSGVGKKLKSLGTTVVKSAVPAAVDYAVISAVEKACEVIEDKLKKLYLRTGRNSAISFSVNLAGILFLIFKPFGEAISRYVAMAFFFSSFVFWLVRTILFIKNYGKTTIEVTKNIFKKKSVYKGIENYVLTSFPLISMGYAGIAVASEFVPSLKKVPRISEFVKFLVKTFWKRIALFASIVATYTVLVFWVVKPLLLRRFM